MELKKLLTDLNDNVSQKYDTSMSTFLDRMGLQEKPSAAESMLPMIGIFGAGIAVGATLGLLFAPKRGENLRGDLRHSIEDISRRGKVRASELVEQTTNGSGSETPTP